MQNQGRHLEPVMSSACEVAENKYFCDQLG